jgi:hypothetical protein
MNESEYREISSNLYEKFRNTKYGESFACFEDYLSNNREILPNDFIESYLKYECGSSIDFFISRVKISLDLFIKYINKINYDNSYHYIKYSYGLYSIEELNQMREVYNQYKDLL